MKTMMIGMTMSRRVMHKLIATQNRKTSPIIVFEVEKYTTCTANDIAYCTQGLCFTRDP